MILTILCSLVVGQSVASPIANVWLSPIRTLTPLRQYHIQDGSGSYRYSFTGPHHAKAESTLNGVTQGGYSYVDANGILQTVSYTADDEKGFRVSASNLPRPPKDEVRAVQDTPEVAAAKREHLQELQNSQRDWRDRDLLSYKILPSYYSLAQVQPAAGDQAQPDTRQTEPTNNPFLLPRSEADRIDVPMPDPSLAKASPSASSTVSVVAAPSLPATAVPLRENALTRSHASMDSAPRMGILPALAGIQAPIAMPASYVLSMLPYRYLHSSLHHTQDSLGQYDYSYTGDSSAKTESRSLDGTTRGAYSYIDPNGILQQVHYIADHNGFRVLATNLPEAK